MTVLELALPVHHIPITINKRELVYKILNLTMLMHIFCDNEEHVYFSLYSDFISTNGPFTFLLRKIKKKGKGKAKVQIKSHTQSTKLSSMYAFVVSTGRLPVMSSSSITPYEKTSDFSVSLPLDAYSGAKYLHITS